ncbi:GspE/PulE family protein [Acinetobacter venetianus]|uniref:Type II secretion system protein E n=1 Tax=Acinetobacter venetianus TaxID=52133 RepID=A0A150HR45_9GAMM|nr:GspE/PulE family protein [Acinetobacter venetianus]KXZ69142.1 Type II secretion system protein E [Acinetobacter venetianus]
MNSQIDLNILKNKALNHENWLEQVSSEQVTQLITQLESLYKIPYWDMDIQLNISDHSISYQEMFRYNILLAKHHEQDILILPSPWHFNLSSLLKNEVQNTHIYFSNPEFIKQHLQQIQSFSSNTLDQEHAHQSDTENSEHIEVISLNSIANATNEVIQTVNAALYDAYIKKASDIHFENISGGLVIRYRLDGILIKVKQIYQTELAQQIVSRIKVLAELDIGERRIPQDGRFTISLEHKLLDFRVSIIPGIFGEDAVLRILDKDGILKQGQKLLLSDLGYNQPYREKLHQIASQPYGMVLMTGPTGSGKTTTVYALINETLKPFEKLITIEDPVEYALDNVLQVPINAKKGLTFAKGLRSILRHDPDKILVGEIRDKETGEIAIQAALTGHLVFTTVHANNVFDVVGRFQHMEIDQFNFVSALNGIIAQRLIRLLCPNCKKQQQDHYIASGCKTCNQTGYKGRKAIAEILVLDDVLKDMIIHRASLAEMKQKALQYGIRSMREQALEMVAKGETSLEEVNRVTFQ